MGNWRAIRYGLSRNGLLVALTCLISVSISDAQPLSIDIASVEWCAANAPKIVRAQIDALEEHDDENSFGFTTVRLKVIETLKGAPSTSLVFVHQYELGRYELEELRSRHVELLLFLDYWPAAKGTLLSYRDYGFARSTFVLRSAAILDEAQLGGFQANEVPWLSSSMEQLKTSAQLVEAVKNYLRNRSGTVRPRPMVMKLPQRFNLGGIPGNFTFPADAMLRPQEFVDSPPPTLETDFSKFKSLFNPKTDLLQPPRHSRQGKGYVGIHALELMAADSDAVYRGIVKDSCSIQSADTSIPGCAARFRVLETLKGSPKTEVNFMVHDPRDFRRLASCDSEIVVFLKSTRRTRIAGMKRQLEFQTRKWNWEDAVVELDGTAEVLFSDLTWHRDADAILQRLRGFDDLPTWNNVDPDSAWYTFRESAPFPVGFQPFAFHPPDSVVKDISIEGNPYSILYLPVDPRLEENARNWTKSEDPGIRWLGAKSLLYFKCPKNVQVLSSLLSDLTVTPKKQALARLSGPYPVRIPKYLVRWEAWHILRAWGHDPPRPDFGEHD